MEGVKAADLVEDMETIEAEVDMEVGDIITVAGDNTTDKEMGVLTPTMYPRMC